MHFLINSVISTTLDVSVIDSLLIGVIAFLPFLPFVRKRSIKAKLWLLSVLVYSSFLLFLTIPIVLSPYPDGFANKFAFVVSDILWNPIDSIGGVASLSDFVRLIIGNFCLLMPVAFLSLTRNPRRSLRHFSVIPLSISLTIEILQFVGNVLIGYSNRTVEAFDVILNVSGAVLSFWITKLIIKSQSSRKEAPQ